MHNVMCKYRLNLHNAMYKIASNFILYRIHVCEGQPCNSGAVNPAHEVQPRIGKADNPAPT